MADHMGVVNRDGQISLSAMGSLVDKVSHGLQNVGGYGAPFTRCHSGTIQDAPVVSPSSVGLVYNNAGMTLSSQGDDANATPLTFNTVLTDTSGFWNVATNDRLTAPATGLFLIGCQVEWNANNAGVRLLGIVANGNYTWGKVRQNACAADTTPMEIVSLASLNVGDYVQALARQSSGGNLSLLAGSSFGGFQFWMAQLK